jgi:hypothetical protein
MFLSTISVVAVERTRRPICRSCAFALVGLIAAASAADASCSLSGPGYRPEQNESVTVEMTCDISGATHLRNIPGQGYVMTGISIASRPHNGALKAWGDRSWSYIPKAPGSDSFSTKQCATLNDSASGCSILHYNVTVQ